MRFLVVILTITLLASSWIVAIAKDDGSAGDQEKVHCCRFDCAPIYCKRYPRACYYIDRPTCERWISHGHANIVEDCGDCAFPRYTGSGSGDS
jgi:hypothetical protein